MTGRAANKFNSIEQVNSTWQQHGKTLLIHVAFLAGCEGSVIPLVVGLAGFSLMHMIKHAVFWDEESITLEWSLKAAEGSDSVDRVFPAVLLALPAPVVNGDLLACLHDVGDVPVRVHPTTIVEDFHWSLYVVTASNTFILFPANLCKVHCWFITHERYHWR